MKTIILCGGRGYRLKEETEFRPKPMITIGDKPVLWHIMKIYAHYGHNDFIIALGYMGDYIKDYFLNQRYFQYNFTLWTKTHRAVFYKDAYTKAKADDFKITFVDTGLETLTGERVRRIREYLNNERFMLTYGDGVSDINIPELIRFHKKKGVIATLTGVHPQSRFGLLRKGNNDLASEFHQKTTIHDWANGGFIVLEPEFFNYLHENEMVEIAFERLARKRQLAIYVHNGYWRAMDTYQDMADLNDLWRINPPWKIWKE